MKFLLKQDMKIKQLIQLTSLEFRHEFRQKNALAGTFIYVVSTVFICYMTFKKVVDVPTWNALFWIILLFAAVNAVARSFLQESPAVRLYYYTLANPVHVVFAKMIYNCLLLISIGLITLMIFLIFMGGLIQIGRAHV